MLNIHAFVDSCIEVLIKAYSNIVAVVGPAYSKFRFDGNNNV